MTFELKRPITDAQLKQAIALRCSDCFPAMNIANALGGYPSAEWEIVRSFSLVDMVQEAKIRSIDLSALEAAVCGGLVVETVIYKKAEEVLLKEVPDEEIKCVDELSEQLYEGEENECCHANG